MESESAQDPRLGVVLNGRYRITELLGEGGMGLVYRGERLQLGRPVAIKFLHGPYAKSPKYMARFEREARAMSKLSHPYCVSVIDFGVHDEPYIVMDFVTGETLRDLMDKARLPAQRVLQITRQILAGLSHAHGQGVIHRDIKPGNIMVGEATGVGDHVRIFDFGLAKLHDPAVEGDHSMATVIGTPAYMAPEQTRAEPIDARADLYAAGVLLFEMLAGEKPFIGDDAYAIIRMQREVTPAKLRTLVPELSAELEKVVAKALEKDRDHRYQTAAEFVAALDETPESYMRASSISNDPPRDVRAATPRPRPESSSTHSLSAEQVARSTRRGLLGLTLVAVVGAFAYLNTREPEQVTSMPLPASRPVPIQKLDAGGPQLVSPSSEPPLIAAVAEDAAVAEEIMEIAEYEISDAGEEELRANELAVADRALDVEEEVEAVPQVVATPVINNVSDVNKLVAKGQIDAAIVGLRQLRKKSPTNPYLPYLMGDLYFDRGWFSDAMAKYREAMKLNDDYRRRVSIQKNAIQALGGDRSYAQARVLLVRDIGAPARKLVQAAAEHDKSPIIRKRAKIVASQLR